MSKIGSSDLRGQLSEEQLELLYALDRLFLRRSEWTTQRDRPDSVADITDEFSGDARGRNVPDAPALR